MSDDAVEIAKAKIAQYEAEIKRLEQFIEMANSLLEDRTMFERYKAEQKDNTATAKQIEPLSGVRIIASSSSPTELILKEAADVLRQEGKPMLAADIFDKVTRRGVRIAGMNPKGNLTAKFSLKREVFILDKETKLWSLAEWSKDKIQEASPDILG